MPYTDAERRPIQMKMFGCLAEEIDAAVLGTITYRVSQNLTEAVLAFAESMLSDAQEAMHFGDAEGARQTINRVKYLLSNERSAIRQAQRDAAQAVTAWCPKSKSSHRSKDPCMGTKGKAPNSGAFSVYELTTYGVTSCQVME